MPDEPAAHVDIHEARANFSQIIERVEHGEEIVISRSGHSVAKVVPLSHRAGRTGRGSLRGTPVTSENWDSDAVNQAIADDFGPTP